LYRTHFVLDGVALKLYYVVLQVVIATWLVWTWNPCLSN